MRRMRCAARTLILAAFFFVALSAAASAGIALLAGVDAFLLDAGTVLGGVFSVIMGLFLFAKAYNHLFLQPIFDKMELQQGVLIAEGLKKLTDSFDTLLAHHITAEDPHPHASDRMHAPLFEADRKILHDLAEMRRLRDHDAKRLRALIRAHNAATIAQRTAVEELACVARTAPRAPRRAEDPPTVNFAPKDASPLSPDALVPEEPELPEEVEE